MGTWNKKSARTVVYGFIPNPALANKACNPVGVPHARNHPGLSSTLQPRGGNRSLGRNSLIRICPWMGWRAQSCSSALRTRALEHFVTPRDIPEKAEPLAEPGAAARCSPVLQTLDLPEQLRVSWTTQNHHPKPPGHCTTPALSSGTPPQPAQALPAPQGSQGATGGHEHCQNHPTLPHTRSTPQENTENYT